MPFVWHSQAIRVSVVCIRMSVLCHLHVLTRMCPYIICMYLYVIGMSFVYIRVLPILSQLRTCMSPVCHCYVLVCHPYVTPMHSYVICMPPLCGLTYENHDLCRIKWLILINSVFHFLQQHAKIGHLAKYDLHAIETLFEKKSWRRTEICRRFQNKNWDARSVNNAIKRFENTGSGK